MTMGVAESEAEVIKPEWFNTPVPAGSTLPVHCVKAVGGAGYEVAGQLNTGATRTTVAPVALTRPTVPPATGASRSSASNTRSAKANGPTPMVANDAGQLSWR